MNGKRPPAEDAERDAWLRAALRHAPDAQVAPPPAVSELILREAQAKAKTSRAAPAGPRWWAWLARPSVGAAFASVMVATAVGLIWWDRPLEDHAPRPAVVTPEPAAAPAPAPAAAAVAVAEAPQPPSVAPPAAPPTVARAKREAARAPTPPAQRDSAAGQAAQRAVAPPPVDATAKAAESMATATPYAMPPPSPTAPPAPAAAPLADAARPATALAAESRVLRQRLAVAADSVSLADLRASLALDASRWTWRRGSAQEQPVGDRITAWLAQLDVDTGAHWRPASGTPASAAAAAETLVLRHEGGALHRLQLGDGVVRWDSTLADGTVRRLQAPIDAATERALRTQLHGTTQ